MDSFFEIDNSDNTSGQGSGAYAPPEATKWNWGAFLLTWIWGLGNRVWFSLFWFIPIIGWFVVPFILGYKGSTWAWQQKRWRHVDHFQKTQNTWVAVGVLFWLLTILTTIVVIVVLVFWLTPIVIDFLSSLSVNFDGLAPLIQLLINIFGLNPNILSPQPQLQIDPYSF